MKICYMSYSLFPRLFLVPLLTTTLTLVGPSEFVFAQETEEADPAEITNGERLFLESRFAQFFKVFLDGGKTVNDPLTEGDPVLDQTVNWQAPSSEHPFKGLSMNCRSCHFVDELGVEEPLQGYGMRTYSDFARRSPVPAREDGKTITVRNSPPLVNASLPRKNFFLHFDAEFTTMVDLVKGTLSGRNYGWIPGEGAMAIAHVAKVIREDNGEGDLASSDFEGIPYKTLLTGTDPSLPEGFVLPKEFRVDVDNATDAQIFQAVSKLIAAYTEDLAFSQDDNGNFNLSPYDVFLAKNGLPQQPRKWESDISYSKRLLRKIKRLERRDKLQFVSGNPNTDDGAFEFHDQSFVFGKGELQGLKIFFKQKKRALRPSDLAKGKIGNCIACHAAPNFTDFEFHNNGVAQEEYDHIHGPGSFSQLEIPRFWPRLINHNEFLPATEQHPHAQELFRAIPTADNPKLTDLGLWNIFLNFDFAKPQQRIWRSLCQDVIEDRFQGRKRFRRCHPLSLLQRSIARFKTPGLRDLGHSAPYNHTGQAETLADVIRLDMKSAKLARNGELRNADSEMKEIGLTEQDIAPLVLFLQSLNEDYS